MFTSEEFPMYRFAEKTTLLILLGLVGCSTIKDRLEEYDFQYCIDRQYEWLNSSVRVSYCDAYEYIYKADPVKDDDGGWFEWPRRFWWLWDVDDEVEESGQV
jgi:hypothetical protein